MQGVKPLRGVLGFQDTCPLPEPSAKIFASFIDRLAQGKTVKDSFAEACTAMGIPKHWAVFCHEEAENDNISDWNSRTLKPIVSATTTFKFFNDATKSGKAVTVTPDPLEVFWSKVVTVGSPAVRVTAGNRSAAANKVAAGDTVTITVKPPSPATTFTAGDKVSITLIYIRENYIQAINVATMFKIKGQTGAAAPVTAKLNSARPSSVGAKDGDDSWVLTAAGTPAEITLTLECVDLDLSATHQHNVPYWLRVKVDPPGTSFDFTRNASILLT
jgi:hypothetical protein